ncbi:8748_t:CDS:2, partial [Scutellospora calospora]
MFNLEQSLYNAEDIPILQEISNEETGDEYTEEISEIDKDAVNDVNKELYCLG